MDEEHWQNEQRLQEERKRKRIEYERELISQIDAKRNSTGNQNLHINRDYINNIKNIKDMLQEEI